MGGASHGGGGAKWRAEQTLVKGSALRQLAARERGDKSSVSCWGSINGREMRAAAACVCYRTGNEHRSHHEMS